MTNPWAYENECIEGDPDCFTRDCPVHWCIRWSWEAGAGCDRPAIACECP